MRTVLCWWQTRGWSCILFVMVLYDEVEDEVQQQEAGVGTDMSG